MKTCPVCQATLFDDMDVCYGCMHEFGPTATPSEAGRAAGPELDAAAGTGPKPGAPAAKGAPLAPRTEEAAAGRHARPIAGDKRVAPTELPWTVRFEVRSGDDPAASWAVELVPADQAQARKAATASR